MERRNGKAIVVPALLACAVVGGFLYLALEEWGRSFGPIVFDETPPPRQLEMPLADVRPVPPAPVPPVRVDSPPDNPVSRSGPDNREVLAQLEKTCRYWSQRSGTGSSSVMREAACNRMREFAGQHGLRAAEIGVRSAPGAKKAQRQVSVDLLGRYEGLCDRHGYRSIEYRRCRADVKDSLKQQCERTRAKQKGARGEAYIKLKDQASEICSVYRRYMIVD